MTRLRLLFGVAVFLAAFLLFLVEPIAAKQLLPILGGSAAVWITCLVFFQTALLCAYLYAHWFSRHSNYALHFALLLLASVSAVAWSSHHLTFQNGAKHPFTTIFTALTLSIGLPFLALGATSPLLQVWLARLESTQIPYRLFALSNLASLLALGLYPTVIEPHFTLQAQRILWCSGFVVFALLSATLAFQTRNAPQVKSSDASAARLSGAAPPKASAPPQVASAARLSSAAQPKTPAPPETIPTKASAALSSSAALPKASAPPQVAAPQAVLWFLLPMGAAMQLAAVTSYLTQNIAALPLLWILPLAVYLITIILAFEFPRAFLGALPRAILIRLMVVMLAGLGYMLIHVDMSIPMRFAIIFFLVELFVSCLFCHTEAYALHPERASDSTLFYLFFAAGGALGSFLIGIASPLLFNFNYDLAIAFLVTALLALAATWRSGWAQRLLWSTAGILLIALVFMIHTAYQRDNVAAVRNFYGTLRVKQNFGYPGAVLRTLANGTIEHGTQIFGSDALRKTPTTYYARDSGIGLALRFCCGNRPRRIGVIGLGAGTIAAYGLPGDTIRFYEINPAVAPIARNLFTYIRESGAQIDIVEGDARNSLAHQPPQEFDVLAIDAFSGDAIPLHLLTTQAVALYRSHLAPGGILAFHISNQHVDLEPAIALLASASGMHAMRVSSAPNDRLGEYSALWVLLTDNPAFFSIPSVAASARTPEKAGKNLRLWTDDYSALLPLIHW